MCAGINISPVCSIVWGVHAQYILNILHLRRLLLSTRQDLDVISDAKFDKKRSLKRGKKRQVRRTRLPLFSGTPKRNIFKNSIVEHNFSKVVYSVTWSSEMSLCASSGAVCVFFIYFFPFSFLPSMFRFSPWPSFG